MANRLFGNYKDLLGGGGVHTLPVLDTDTIKAILIDIADDDPDTSSDQDLADIAAGARVATATLVTVTFGTVAAGRLDAADLTFPTVTGDQSEEILIYGHTGTESTSPLIVVLDTFSAGMPVTPNGANIVVVWHASGIFGF